MSALKFRLAKPSDADQIARVHYKIRDQYNQGFFQHVNFAFMKQYYKIVLDDPCELFVCAEDGKQNIVGFCCATMDVERQFKNTRKNKYKLVIPLLLSACRHPRLLKDAWDRYKSTDEHSDKSFVSGSGARAEYWVWLPGRDDSEQSVVMQDIMYYMMKMFGVEKLYFEVDKVNKNVYKFHKINGAEEVKSFIMPDGRERVELVYDMNTYNFKLK